MKIKLYLIIFATLFVICGCNSDSGTDTAEIKNENYSVKSHNIIMLIDEIYYDDYMKLSIDKSIEDNLHGEYALELVVLERDINDNWKYILPEKRIEDLIDNNEASNSIILFGIAPEDNICSFISSIKDKVFIVFVDNIYLDDLPFDVNYNIYIDYDDIAMQQGRLISKAIDESGGDILLTSKAKNSIDQNEMTLQQNKIVKEVLLKTEYDENITFTYGYPFVELAQTEYDLLDQNREMTDAYLSFGQTIISIVGETESTCYIWLEAIKEYDLKQKPLIFGCFSDYSGFELIENNENVILFSNSYAYYELVNVALKCITELNSNDALSRNVNLTVKIPLLNTENYREHYHKYSHIYSH